MKKKICMLLLALSMVSVSAVGTTLLCPTTVRAAITPNNSYQSNGVVAKVPIIKSAVKDGDKIKLCFVTEPGAAAYYVEWSKNFNFNNAKSKWIYGAAHSETKLSVPSSGTYYVRMRTYAQKYSWQGVMLYDSWSKFSSVVKVKM